MLRSVLAAFVLTAAAAATSAQPKRPVDLFPPATLAYAEVDDPAALADAVAAVVKRSSLDDGLKLLHDRRDANKDPRLFHGQPALSLLVTATAPETLAEVRKFRGAAVGLTGFTKSHEPKIAAVVLFGESTAAGLLAKAYLTNEATFRRVDVLDGVPVFQSRAAPAVSYDPNSGKPVVPEAAKATEGPLEPTYAYTPGLFVVGSNKEAVADVLARHRGMVTDSFATGDAYKQLAQQRAVGVNYCVRLADFVAAADRARKAGKDVLDPTALAYLRHVVGPAAAMLAGHCTLGPNGPAVTLTIARTPGKASPLLDLLDGGLAPAVLDVCPADFAAVATVALPKADRAAVCLRLADAVAGAEGELGKLPSDWVAEFEQRTKLELRAKLLPAVRAVSLLLPTSQELPTKVEPLPFVALHFESAADADAAAAAFPTLLAAARDVPPGRPTAETVAGVQVLSLADAGGPIHFARSRDAVVIGRDRVRVAACCASGNRLPPTVPRPDGATAAHVAVLPRGLAVADPWGFGKLLNRTAASGGGGVDFLIDNLPLNVASPAPLFATAELTAAFGSVPPVVARVARSTDRISVEVRLDCTATGVHKVIDALVPIIEKVGAGGHPSHGRLYGDR